MALTAKTVAATSNHGSAPRGSRYPSHNPAAPREPTTKAMNARTIRQPNAVRSFFRLGAGSGGLGCRDVGWSGMPSESYAMAFVHERGRFTSPPLRLRASTFSCGTRINESRNRWIRERTAARLYRHRECIEVSFLHEKRENPDLQHGWPLIVRLTQPTGLRAIQAFTAQLIAVHRFTLFNALTIALRQGRQTDFWNRPLSLTRFSSNQKISGC